ncbi:MAG TPA: maleylpyruvate isomerase family mycothiol-dependent enzyme [Mycobacteriales bacterium]|nr:maleylpyruvate isomerase family mycothiol-dependent enzyme [Mycobacteriales bacterium]
MEIDTLIAALAAEGPALAGAAAKAGVGAHVPTCPDWSVADLLRHLGGVHRWATTIVAERRPASPSDEEVEPWFTGPADDELLDWFDAGHGALVAALRAADPAADFWAFLPAPSPLAFWARRQAHETCVHRLDVEAAAGMSSEIDPALAVDGIDELLFGFFSRKRSRLVADPPVSLALRSTDTGDGWTVRVGAEAREVVREAGSADCSVSGPAAALYAGLWNRRPLGDLDVAGDSAVLEIWRERALVTWS